MIGRVGSLILLALALWTGSAQAQLQVEARFDRGEAYVGETVTLEVSLVAAAARIPKTQLELPATLERYFEVQATGNSYQTTIRNGVSQVQQTTTYQLLARRPGDLRLGPVRIITSGRSHESQPLAITIRPAPSGPGTSEQPAPYFAELRIQPKGAVYPGQEVRASVVLYAGAPIVRWGLNGGALPDMPKLHREVIDASREVQQSTVDWGGRRYYQAAVLQLALYPLVSGDVTIPPFSLQVQLSSTPAGGRGGLDPLFESLLRSVRGRTVQVDTPEQVLEVRPLPEEGRPAGFNGAVGEIAASGRLDQAQVEVGGVLGYTLDLMVRGDPEGVLPPTLLLPADFDGFDTQVTQTPVRTPEGGVQYRKRFSYLIVPRRPGVERFSPIELAWFDPEGNAYRTWKAPPVAVTVTGEAVAGLTGGPEQPAMSTEGVLARAELRYIKPDATALQLKGNTPWQRTGFYALLVLPVALFGLSLTQGRRLARARSDRAWARRQGAARVFEKRLKGIAMECALKVRLAAASQALLDLIGDLWNFEPGGLTHGALDVYLADEGLGEELRMRVLNFLAETDEVRFAGLSVSEDGPELTEQLKRLAKELQEARS